MQDGFPFFIFQTAIRPSNSSHRNERNSQNRLRPDSQLQEMLDNRRVLHFHDSVKSLSLLIEFSLVSKFAKQPLVFFCKKSLFQILGLFLQQVLILHGRFLPFWNIVSASRSDSACAAKLNSVCSYLN